MGPRHRHERCPRSWRHSGVRRSVLPAGPGRRAGGGLPQGVGAQVGERGAAQRQGGGARGDRAGLSRHGVGRGGASIGRRDRRGRPVVLRGEVPRVQLRAAVGRGLADDRLHGGEGTRAGVAVGHHRRVALLQEGSRCHLPSQGGGVGVRGGHCGPPGPAAPGLLPLQRRAWVGAGVVRRSPGGPVVRAVRVERHRGDGPPEPFRGQPGPPRQPRAAARRSGEARVQVPRVRGPDTPVLEAEGQVGEG
mmetsp:Transcript_95881/g.253262  ORF Transcript_95881/g.253262 Transcript_95881/m.253262 type:complete len:248 (-) Transcript_95881:2167-2910(-)